MIRAKLTRCMQLLELHAPIAAAFDYSTWAGEAPAAPRGRPPIPGVSPLPEARDAPTRPDSGKNIDHFSRANCSRRRIAGCG